MIRFKGFVYLWYILGSLKKQNILISRKVKEETANIRQNSKDKILPLYLFHS